MYNQSILLLKNFQESIQENIPERIQETIQNTFINERTPFYFISSVFLLITIILSLMSAIYSNENYSDFFPNPGKYYDMPIHDNTIVDRLCWYFSQITHHTIILLFFYFFLAFINHKSEKFFKMVAPLALTISVLYFVLLYPRQKLQLHQLSFSNFFSHFMIIFLVFGEFMYIKDYTFKETTHCFIFILTCLCAITINYLLRGVWSYNMVKLDRYNGWKLVSITVMVMYFFSFLFYFFKYKNKKNFGIETKVLLKSVNFFSGMIGIIWFQMTFK